MKVRTSIDGVHFADSSVRLDRDRWRTVHAIADMKSLRILFL